MINQLLCPTAAASLKLWKICFFVFYVFNVSYPDDLRMFYGFIEYIMGIDTALSKSMTVRGLFRALVNTKLSPVVDDVETD